MVSRFGRYELVQLLGKGGMAEVFLARMRGIEGYEKRLVIKRVLPSLSQDPRFLRLFFEEARLHAGLSHGNLVSIFDFGRVGNDYFLAMELVDGCDLSRLLRSTQGNPLAPELVAYLGAELCHALQHVHRHHLVHRDLTPRNVLLSLDGEVKLTDFGVARNAASADGARGTIVYMAPEQARGEQVDARADLYALGLLIAESSTGERVRRAPPELADAELLQAIGRAQPLCIEGPFADLVARATASDPAQRYADADTMAAELEGIASRLGATRASNARALAERVRVVPREVAGEVVILGSAEQASATYYRDATTAASLIDDIVGPSVPPPPPRRARRATTIVVMLASIAAAGLVFRMSRSESPRPPVPPVAAPTRTMTLPAPSVPPPPVPKPEPSPDQPAHHELPSSLGSVDVLCRPWCVVDVDGRRHGEDSRHHLLRLSAGRHRLMFERLDDRQTREIEVRAATPQAVDVSFD